MPCSEICGRAEAKIPEVEKVEFGERIINK